MSLAYIILWFVLLYFASKSKSSFLFFFVLCQFLFIGLGLSLFQFLGKLYLISVFPSFDFTTIDETDFNLANFLLIASNIFVVFYLNLMTSVSTRKYNIISVNNTKEVNVRYLVILLLSLLSLFVAIPFIIDNYKSFAYLLLASSAGDLGDSVEFRQDSTSNYLSILVIYNILPAVAILSFLQYLQNHKVLSFLFFGLLMLLVSACLIMTFQKRPLLVFWGAIGLTFYLWEHASRKGKATRFLFADLIKQQKTVLFFLLMTLFIFYYFYTGYRFDSDILDTFLKIGEVVFTRLVGRLSIPAVMYIDFFPYQHDFYGLSNVGLFSRLFGSKLFMDTSFVYSNYSSNEGSLAASVFFDAYGQGGFLVALIYAPIIAIIIWVMDYIAHRSSPGIDRVFFVVSGFIFIYYLSQASLFRAAFGYGWFFYLLIGFIGIKSQNISVSSEN